MLDSTYFSNACEVQQLWGAPQLSLRTILQSSAFKHRLPIAPSRPEVDVHAAGHSPSETRLTVTSAGAKRERPVLPAEEGGDDVVDLQSDVWRRRRAAQTGNINDSGALTVSTGGSGGEGSTTAATSTKWKISKILVGHQGWVWAAAVDPTNQWFATGGFDAVIKVWDLASGTLKLDLVSHKEAVRCIAMSKTSPYMFSGSDDHAIKCWDLERNEVIREFFGHRSSVHCVSVHAMLDVVVSGGRDNTVRVWDIRTRREVHTLIGHRDSVMSLATQTVDPQVISGGSDGFIYLWDLAAGKALTRLTRHKKPVRGLAVSPNGAQLISCGADEIRVWQMPNGEFECNANTVVPKKGRDKGKNKHGNVNEEEELSYLWSSCSMSPRGTLAVGSQDGHLAFYDWNTQRECSLEGARVVTPFYRTKTSSIPGTLEGEGGINHITYDASGTRLITAESDKSVKIWRSKTSG